MSKESVGVVLAGEDDEEEDEEVFKMESEERKRVVSDDSSTESRVVLEMKPSKERNPELWSKLLLNPTSENGAELMAKAVSARLTDPLNAIIDRISELSENQEHLLGSLKNHKQSLNDFSELETIQLTMAKLPGYQMKVLRMIDAMENISNRVKGMSVMTADLQMKAHERALAKEEQRDAETQWNKLYAAKKSQTVVERKIKETVEESKEG